MSRVNTCIDSELISKYQKKTDKQHILDNPDTYIGSIEQNENDMWILDDDNNTIIKKKINYIPALFKLFDEGIVNCRDHVIRMTHQIDDYKLSNNNNNNIDIKKIPNPVTYINITIEDDGTIIMVNDGNGIDIAKHPEYNLWIPELIFGHLRTSTNYNKDEKKIVGGKNGFGFKLVLIWSIYGSIETIDHTRGLKYFQEFKNNLNDINKPIISKTKKKPYTKITFKPDYERLGIPGLSNDIISLFKKRIYDIAAITNKNINVKYNSNKLHINNFKQYIDLYIGTKSTNKRVFETYSDDWEYGVSLSTTHEFEQISFVNGIHTTKGGKHVDYIIGQITRKIIAYIEKKKNVTVSANNIKEQLIIFIRCNIINPVFDSQTKDYMNTPSSKFGSICKVSDKFIEGICKMGVMETACAINNIKENKKNKKNDGNKIKKIRGIHKLLDANWAGGDKSDKCTIILCEGDSAKAGIVSGLTSEDRNIIGVYPLKGKLLNVRGEIQKRISNNKEIIEIKKILGLETNIEYTKDNISNKLRYSKIIFMTDQDLDGSHIKGLCINLFQSEWPSLSKIPGFIGFMNTPIIKMKKGKTEIVFYNDGEYNNWKNNNNITGWNIKYYKGLGTSTGKEFKEYFKQKKIVGFTHGYSIDDEKKSIDNIDMVFNKKRAKDRKVWLNNYDNKSYLNTSSNLITYTDFINKELIHFSKYDCERNIPNVMDGLKISLRKILFSSFKKNLIREIKVAQFSGYVSEHSCYHHGEASLNGAIVGMAQNYVGSNNINLLLPNGQFGTRSLGGKDSASERYIFTELNRITRFIFPSEDDNILDYLNDDGTSIEPRYYAPIIPLILVNGSKGIGTGFSTDILCYNTFDIIKYIKFKLNNETQMFTGSIEPYYEGFTGSIKKLDDNKYMFKGVYKKINKNKIQITELPIGIWTDDYKLYLEQMLSNNSNSTDKILKDYDDMSKDTNINIILTLYDNVINKLENKTYENNLYNGIESTFKLYTTKNTNNMHAFNNNNKLCKYDTIFELIDDYYITRLQLYDSRKKYLICNLENEYKIIKNKYKYINEIINDTIIFKNNTKQQIINILSEKEYDVINNDIEYKYLIKMTIDSLTHENIIKLKKECTNKQQLINDISNTSIHKLWDDDLKKLEIEFNKYKLTREI
jgi:DNA topoisomerase-2